MFGELFFTAAMILPEEALGNAATDCGQLGACQALVIPNVITIIKVWMGDSAVNEDKTEGPSLHLEVIGYHVDMPQASISPSLKGLCKMCYFLLRAVPPSCRSISVERRHSMIGVLWHYATVMPVLYGSLNHLQSQLVAAQNSAKLPQSLNLNAASRKELEFWRMTLLAGL
jgi:hypothetical protein